MTVPSPRVSAVLLVALAIVRMALTFTVFSATTDEPSHIAGGLELMQYRKYELQTMNPPLARLVMSAAPYAAGVRIRAEGTWEEKLHDVFYNHLPYERNLVLARIGNLLFFALGAAMVWAIARRELGENGGLLSLLLYTMQPIVLGYSALATHDGPGLASFAVAMYAFARWLRQPDIRRELALGAAYGFAISCKFSAIPYVPAACAAIFVCRLCMDRQSRGSLLRALPRMILVVTLVTPVMIWAGYGFTIGTVGDLQYFRAVPGMIGDLARLDPTLALPAPGFFRGVGSITDLDRQGLPSYLFGEFSSAGWWWYFLVAVLLKTTLPFLLLTVTGAFVVWRWHDLRGAYVEGLAASAAILLVSSTSNLQIGVRYVLPLYVPLTTAAAAAVLALYRSHQPLVKRVAVAIVALHVVVSVVAHPDYFPYFNLFGGGDPSRYLADSNVDWSQDNLRLRSVVRELGIERLAINSGGITDYARLGFPPVEKFSDPYIVRDGWVAISDHFYRIDRSIGGLHWLRGVPYRRVGKSIRLYRVPPRTGPNGSDRR